MSTQRRLLRMAASREHNHGATMKKTTSRPKLVLHAQVIKVLRDEQRELVIGGAVPFTRDCPPLVDPNK